MEYGEYVFASTVAFIITIFYDFGGEQSIVGIFSDFSNKNYTIKLHFGLKVIFGIVLIILGIICHFIFRESLIPLLILINILSAFIPLWYFQFLEKTLIYSLIHLLYSVTRLIIIYSFSKDLITLFQEITLITAIYSMVLFLFFKKRKQPILNNWRRSFKILKYAPISVSNYLFTMSPILALKLFMGNEFVAIYNLYSKGVSLIGLVSGPILSQMNMTVIKSKVPTSKLKIPVVLILAFGLISLTYHYFYVLGFLKINTEPYYGFVFIFFAALMSYKNQIMLRLRVLRNYKPNKAISYLLVSSLLVFCFIAFFKFLNLQIGITVIISELILFLILNAFTSKTNSVYN